MPLATMNKCVNGTPCYNNKMGKMAQSKRTWIWEDKYKNETKGKYQY